MQSSASICEVKSDSLQKALSITAVYVTHDQEEAMAISDHIAVMNEGKIVQIGTAEELYLRPESPFVAQFIGKINLLEAEVKEVREAEASLEILGQIYEIPNRIAKLASRAKGERLHKT